MDTDKDEEVLEGNIATTDDINSVLGQVNLRRIRNTDDIVINHDRIKMLNSIRERVAMLDQQE